MSSAIKQLYDKGAIPPANWTIIIYLNGESDLLDDVKRNYNQVAKFGSELGKVNFVVLFDGIKVPEAGSDAEKGDQNLAPQLYYVSRYENFTEAKPLEEFPEQENLAKKGSLAAIVHRIKEKFTAEKYGFIYNGHAQAGGPAVDNKQLMVKLDARLAGETEEAFGKRLERKYARNGWSVENTCEHIDNPAIILVILEKEYDGESLTYEMMGKELEAAGFNRKNEELGFVCLDCCWGHTFEATICFRECTRYLIASPDEAALFGIGYDDFAEFLLKKERTVRFDELANNLVGIYFKHNYADYLTNEVFNQMGVSLSCTDNGEYNSIDPYRRRIDDAVLWKMDKLADYLTDNMERLWWVISWARKKCVDYTYQKDVDYYATYNIDFLWFLENLMHYNNLYDEYGGETDPKLHLHASRLAMELSMRFIKSNLASNYKTLEINSREPQLGGKGLAITFPVTSTQFSKSIYGSGAFSGNNAWRQFLEKYVEMAKSKPEKMINDQPKDTNKWNSVKHPVVADE
ncbi:MAG: hypothetical protein JNM19_18015 [Chitinophagaceae bacterium]|nr:hypothetical protein [Chitinophagaceae bacterium]